MGFSFSLIVELCDWTTIVPHKSFRSPSGQTPMAATSTGRYSLIGRRRRMDGNNREASK